MVNSWLKPGLKEKIGEPSPRFSLAFLGGQPVPAFAAKLLLRLHLMGAIAAQGKPRGTNMVPRPLPKQFAAYPCIVSMSDVPSPASLSAVQSRIDDIADQAGVAGAERLTVDDTLAALPWPFRRRLVLTLQSLQAFSPDPEVQRAAEFFQLKAARVWAAMPFQGHTTEDTSETTVLVEHGSRRPTAAQGKKP